MLSKAKCLEKIVLPTPFLVGPVNIYLIKSDALTLIDTGPKTEETKEALVKSLKQHRYSPEDIDQIVLTHHHPDHVGLIEELFPKAKIIGHKNCDPWLRKEKEFTLYVEEYIDSFHKMHGVPPEIIEQMVRKNRYYLSFTSERGLDFEVSEGDFVDGLNGWKVIYTPGHAQSHISLYHEKDGRLIGGDHIISHISSNALLEPPSQKGQPRPRTLVQYRTSLQKCLDLNVRKVYSGHGEDVQNLQELLNLRFLEQDEKAARLRTLIPSEGISSFELCKQYFPHIYKKEATLTMSEIIGHLDLLEESEAIKTFEREGIIYYKN